MAALCLFKLPESALQNVLRNMDPLELLTLSVCSKKCKTIVKNLNLHITNFYVDFEDDLTISATLPDSFTLQLYFDPRLLEQSINPEIVGADDIPVRPRWLNLSFSFEFWVRHLYSVFNCHEISRCWFSWADDRYDMESVKRSLTKLTVRVLSLGWTLSENNYQLVLATGIPSKCLILHNNPYQNSDILRRVLTQNYDVIDVWGFFPGYFSKLKNILSVNSLSVTLSECNFSEKNINRFLKLWKQNSSSRIKKFEVRFDEDHEIDEDAILKGVNHTVNPLERTRTMNLEVTWGLETLTVTGGYDVRRSDGVEATVQFITRRSNKFDMTVWDN